MDARELTKVVNDHDADIIELKKQVEYLTQEVEKLRLLMGDIKYDVKDLQRRNWHGKDKMPLRVLDKNVGDTDA